MVAYAPNYYGGGGGNATLENQEAILASLAAIEAKTALITNGSSTLNLMFINGYLVGPLVSKDDYNEDTDRLIGPFTFPNETFPATKVLLGIVKPGKLDEFILIVETTPETVGDDLVANFQLTGEEWYAIADGAYKYAVTLVDEDENRVTKIHSANHPDPYKHVTILKALTYANS